MTKEHIAVKYLRDQLQPAGTFKDTAMSSAIIAHDADMEGFGTDPGESSDGHL
jgi:hypothetical protein